MNRYRHLLLIILLLIGGSIIPSAQGQSNSGRIEQVKAAFILNIARFVTWPAEALPAQNRQLLLCLYQGNLNNKGIALVEGKKVGGRTLTIRYIESLNDSHLCNILLIADHALDDFIAEVPPGLNRPMLTIADFTERPIPSSLPQEVLVALVRNESRINFHINLNKVRQVGLWMSSKLLKLATIVGGKK